MSSSICSVFCIENTINDRLSEQRDRDQTNHRIDEVARQHFSGPERGQLNEVEVVEVRALSPLSNRGSMSDDPSSPILPRPMLVDFTLDGESIGSDQTFQLPRKNEIPQIEEKTRDGRPIEHSLSESWGEREQLNNLPNFKKELSDDGLSDTL